MNLTANHFSLQAPWQSLKKARIHSGGVYSALIVLALITFEALNYSTTAYALRDLLGDLSFIGVSWATLMALAFCSLDFAGIARLVTQKTRVEGASESWYLFGAWLIAATFNAALTWWGVTIAIANHPLRSAEVVNTRQLTTVAPVIVAILVWVIRILIIGSLASALDRSSPKRSRATAAARKPVPGAPQAKNRPAQGFQHVKPLNTRDQAPVSRASIISMAKATPPRNPQPLKQNDFLDAEQRRQ